MSKVALSGNASGTGTFTIASPNSNTDRTLTLPDATGTVLTTATAGVPINGPAFSAYQSGAQSLSPNTWTKAQIATEEFDTNSNYDTSNYRFTPTVAGYYQVNGSILFNYYGGATYLVGNAVYKNGTQFKAGTLLPVTNQTDGAETSLSALVYLNGSTDYIELYVLQTSASTLPLIINTPSRNYFQAFLARSAT